MHESNSNWTARLHREKTNTYLNVKLPDFLEEMYDKLGEMTEEFSDEVHTWVKYEFGVDFIASDLLPI